MRIQKPIIEMSLAGAVAFSLRLPCVFLPTHTHERKVFQSLSAKTNAHRRFASARNDDGEIGRRMQVMVRCPTPNMDGQMLVEENVRRVPRMR